MGQGPSQPEAPSPSLAEIEARQRAEAAAEQAIQDAAAARAEIIKLVQEHQESQHRVMEAHLDAMNAAAVAQTNAHAEIMAMVRAERAANEALMKAEAAARTASDEAKQSAAQAEEERKRTLAIQEQAIKDARAAAEQAKRLEEAANEERRKATALQEAANVAKEEVAKANATLEKAERQLREGIQPVVTPSPEEVRMAKRKVQYQQDLFHFAVAGTSGGGKSSLINAFRGLRNKDCGAAATGVAETTRSIARYSDSDMEAPYAWYDIPGAGTLKIPDWQYFNAQGLYVFDCIVVLFDNRFTMTDIAILTNCRRFNIPTYIVRSKADQHILNIMQDMPDDDDEDGDDETRNKRLYPTARQHFINLTRQSVKDNLESANLPDQRVYIVSKDIMTGIVRQKRPKQVIDEIELLNDLFGEAQIRRSRRDGEAATTTDM